MTYVFMLLHRSANQHAPECLRNSETPGSNFKYFSSQAFFHPHLHWTASTMRGYLPPETWAHILKYAKEDAISTLGASAAVSRTLREITLPILYRTLTARIYVPDLHEEDYVARQEYAIDMATMGRLLQCCADSAVAAQQVREFVLDIDFDWKNMPIGMSCTHMLLCQ